MVAAFIETRPFERAGAAFAAVPAPVADRRADVVRRPAGRVGDVRRRASRADVVRRPVSRTEYRRRRTVAAGLVIAAALGLFMAVQALLGGPAGGPLTSVGSPGAAQPAAARIWVVHPGDTLWTIALASGARGDIRPLVDKLNAEVGGKPLQPGERILIP